LSDAVDVSTEYLGLKLRTPLVASSSPLTGNLDDLRRLEDAGISAVVLPSVFEEQINAESVAIHDMLDVGAGSSGEAASYFPDLGDYNTGPDHYFELVARAKQQLAIPVIASLNGTTPGGWAEYARDLEQAGADAIELNLYLVSADPHTSPEVIEGRYRDLVARVSAEVTIPVAVKLSPFFTALAHTAHELVGAGARGLVLFNRFYQPELDLESLQVEPHLLLSHSEELRLPLRWIAILRGQLSASLAATSGIHTSESVLKALLTGADVAMMASALLTHGPGHVTELERALLAWLEEREYESVTQMKGSVSQKSYDDPAAFERANYIRTLRSWSGS
jgi:dihydroorotate dehydrogenase (fumarate)